MTALFKFKSSCLLILPLALMTQEAIGDSSIQRSFSMGNSSGVNFVMTGVNALTLGTLSNGPGIALANGDVFIINTPPNTYVNPATRTWGSMGANCIGGSASSTTSRCTIVWGGGSSTGDLTVQVEAANTAGDNATGTISAYLPTVLNLSANFSGGTTPHSSASYELLDVNNKLVSQGVLNWNTPVNIYVDPSGAPWTLKTPMVYDSSAGQEYSPSESTQTIPAPAGSSPISVALTYSPAGACTTEQLSIQTSGLPQSTTTSFTATDANPGQPPLSVTIQNGSSNLNICQDGEVWSLNPANSQAYLGTANPRSITANQASENINVTYSDKPLTSGLLVGYLQNWGTQISISQAAQMGYNVVVLAFACLSENTGNSGCTSGKVDFYNGSFPGYTTPKDMLNDIANAKANYGLKYVLASFGGATIADYYLDNQGSATNLAKDVVATFLNPYGLDGIDLDDEKSLTSDGPAMKSFLQALKQLKLSNGATPLVSSAPQFNSIGPSDLELVSTGTNTAYNDALKARLFDYVFVQGYNTPGNYINDCDELMPCFITQGGAYLGTPSNPSVIPLTTTIIMGNPASSAPSAAGSSVFQNAKIANPYQALANEYSLAVLNPRLGGAMTWSITEDADAQCQFSKAMAPVITGVDPSTLQCP